MLLFDSEVKGFRDYGYEVILDTNQKRDVPEPPEPPDQPEPPKLF